MTNVRALNATLRHLKQMGRLEPTDSAIVQALRSMAASLDEDPSNAALWRQYRETLGGLMADDGDGSIDDAIAELFGQVHNTAPSRAGDLRRGAS